MNQHKDHPLCLKLLSALESCTPFNGLQSFLDEQTDSPQSCSPHLITLLIQLTRQVINRDHFDKQEINQVQLILQTLQHLAGYQEYPDGLQVLLNCGFTQLIKMIEKGLQLVLQHNEKDIDELYDVILETVVACADYSESVRLVLLKLFLDRFLKVVVSENFRFTIRFETLKSANLLVEIYPAEVKDSLAKSEQHRKLMRELASLIPNVGDYEFQVGLTECLFRLNLKSERSALSKTWFSDSVLRKEFLKVKDSHFEADSRSFLNTINLANNGKERVLSFPCMRTLLGNYEIFKPDDPDYSEFWVDFNTSSHRITMFCQRENSSGQEEEEDNLWETVSVWEDNVLGYTFEDKGRCVVLHIQTQENCKDLIGFGPEFVNNHIFIEFDAKYPIREAVGGTLLTSNRRNKNQKKQPKVSVGMMYGSEERTKQQTHPLTQATSLSRTVHEKVKRKQKVSVPSVLSTPVSLKPDLNLKKSEEAITPRRNPAKPKRVRTPLQMVHNPTVLKAPQKRNLKVSVPVMDNHPATVPKQANLPTGYLGENKGLNQTRLASQQSNKDENIVIPSSAPEEQVLTVPDSQPTYLTSLPALSEQVSRIRARARYIDDSGLCLDSTDEAVNCPSSSLEKIHQLKDELKSMEPDFCAYPKTVVKASNTPCLSTVSEESGPGGSKYSSQQSLKQRLNTINEDRIPPPESDFALPDSQQSKSTKKKIKRIISSSVKQKEKPVVCVSPDSTSVGVVTSTVAVGSQDDLFVTQLSGQPDKTSVESKETSSQRKTRSRKDSSPPQVLEHGKEDQKKSTKQTKRKRNVKCKKNLEQSGKPETTTTGTEGDQSSVLLRNASNSANLSTDDEFVKPLPVLPRKKKENVTDLCMKNATGKNKSKTVLEQSKVAEMSSQDKIKQKKSSLRNDFTDDNCTPVDNEFVKPLPVSVSAKKINHIEKYSNDDTRELLNDEFVKPLPVSPNSKNKNNATEKDNSQNASVYDFSQESLYSNFSQDPCLITRCKLSGVNLSLDREKSKLSIKRNSLGESSNSEFKPKFFKSRAKERLGSASQKAGPSSVEPHMKNISADKNKLQETETQKQNKSGTKSQPKDWNHCKVKIFKLKETNPELEKLSKICGKQKHSTSEKFKEDVACAFGFEDSEKDNDYRSGSLLDREETTEAPDTNDTRHNKSSKQSAGKVNSKANKENLAHAAPRNREISDEYVIEDSENVDMCNKNNFDVGALADVSSNATEMISDFAKNIVQESNGGKKRSKRAHKRVNYKIPTESDLDSDDTPIFGKKVQKQKRTIQEEYLENKATQVKETTKRTKKGRKHIFSDTADETFDTRSEVSWLCKSSTKKRPKIEKTYCTKAQSRAHTDYTADVDEELSDSESEVLPKPKLKEKTRKTKPESSTPQCQQSFNQEVQGSVYLFADDPVTQTQEPVKMKPQPKKKKPQRSNHVTDKCEEILESPQVYKDTFEETLLIEDENKKQIHKSMDEPRSRSSGQDELEETIQDLCTASVQALANLGSHKNTKKSKKTTSCVVNEICSEEFATELRNLFDKAMKGKEIVETPKTRTFDVKKKNKKSKKTPKQQIKSKKYKELNVQITKTPIISSVVSGFVEDEIETFRYEDNLNMGSVAISPILPVCKPKKLKLPLKEQEIQESNEDHLPENLLEEILPEKNLPDENFHDNFLLSQNSNFSHISSLKTPKTPFTSRDVEMGEREAEDHLSLLNSDSTSGPCKRRKRRSNCESQDSNMTDEEMEEVDPETVEVSKTLKPRKLFNNYPEVHCSQVESEEEQESEEDEDLLQHQIKKTSHFSPGFIEPGDSGIQSSVKSLLQTFGTDIQRNLVEKKKCIEGFTKASLKITQKQVTKTWNRQNVKRRGILEGFKNTLAQELKLLEAEMTSMKQAEDKVLECFRQTLQVIQSSRRTQESRLQNLANAQNEFEDDIANVEESVESEKVSLQDNLRKEMVNLQKKILFQSQQQEIANVKKSLSAMFL